ncbi:MAG TPA: hypothetical protein GX497_04085 [Bacillus bacterium]|nr:hypothetical protein [Bacillus sp. (in: firmicutes)]
MKHRYLATERGSSMLYILGVVAIVIGTLLTLSVAKEDDKTYRKKDKSNIIRLTSIYAVVITLSFIFLGLYIANTN